MYHSSNKDGKFNLRVTYTNIYTYNLNPINKYRLAYIILNNDCNVGLIY